MLTGWRGERGGWIVAHLVQIKPSTVPHRAVNTSCQHWPLNTHTHTHTHTHSFLFSFSSPFLPFPPFLSSSLSVLQTVLVCWLGFTLLPPALSCVCVCVSVRIYCMCVCVCLCVCVNEIPPPSLGLRCHRGRTPLNGELGAEDQHKGKGF